MSKTFLNPLAILNIISGHLHRGNILGAVESLKDLPWVETEKTETGSHYELPELKGKRSILGGDSDTIVVNLKEYSFFLRETAESKTLKVSSFNGYKMEKNY